MHRGQSLVIEAKLFSDGGGDIEDSTSDEGTAVIDSDDRRAAIAEVGDADGAGEGEGFVCSGAGAGAKSLTDGGGSMPPERSANVIGGDACFFVAEGLAGVHGVVTDAADSVGGIFVTAIGLVAGGFASG